MSVQLNFARKWRSKSFDQLVGQDISVRILKNSLYLNHYFPVYLFAGQRGCGKTTMARIFAAAINCEQLLQFQQDPKQFCVPCLLCASCKAMAEGKHPDFIEIDAASYTGVDNVRHIIDTAALLPLIGRKKVYLIDEAHMLSKAAFNAFLKVLEEPPASVLFILATTELQKIIDTVRSRSFQLFFKAVKPTVLIEYLEQVCTAENIAYERDGLALIVQETQGSVRDALNMLEQVRFAVPTVTRASVSSVLGHIDDATLLQFFECILAKDAKRIVTFLQEQTLQGIAFESLWYGLVRIAQTVLQAYYDLPLSYFGHHETFLKNIVAQYTHKDSTALLKLLFVHEPLFIKTQAQHMFLEMILLDFCSGASEPKKIYEAKDPLPVPPTTIKKVASVPPDIQQQKTAPSNESIKTMSNDPVVDQKWQSFLAEIELLQDPLLNSIFKQVQSLSFDAVATTMTLVFSKDLIFFKEWLENTTMWKPCLQKIFGQAVQCNPLFEHDPKIAEQKQEHHSNQVPLAKPISMPKQKPSHKNTSSLDISDTSQWKKASLVMEYFPGILQEVKESHHE